MSNKMLEQLIAEAKQNPELADAFGRNLGDVGDHTKDEVLKQEIIREIITSQAGAMSVGTELIGTRQMNQKAISFAYPGSATAEYPVAPDTLTDRQRFTWREFDLKLKRGQARYFISDDAKLSGMADMQAERASAEAARSLALKKDENILGTLLNGAFSENESTASEYWNHPDASTDSDAEIESVMMEELRQMWEEILVNTPLESADTGEVTVVLPIRVYTYLSRLKLINNIQQQIEDYLSQQFNFNFVPTKMHMHDEYSMPDLYDGADIADTAMMILTGENTAVHGELSAEAANAVGVPLVEGPNRDFGLGEDYLITQWFNTGIMEHESGNAGETPRIAIRHGVNYYENEE